MLKIPKGMLEEATYEDTENPYHYFRVDAMEDADRVIVGGEDHRRDTPVPDAFCEYALRGFLERTFGAIPHRTVASWKGSLLEPSDGLPIIGPYEHDNTFYASGFSGNGLTYGTLAALMFADCVLGRENPWVKIFKARRFPYPLGLAIKARDYVGKFFGGAVKNALRPVTARGR